MSVNEIDEPGDEEEGDDDGPDESEDETSFDAFLSKAKDSGKNPSNDEEDDDSLLDLSREERLESLSVRAAPKQANEFVCTSCRLVKHESQMADRTRELCRDCV